MTHNQLPSPVLCVEEEVEEQQERSSTHEEEGGHPEEHSKGLLAATKWNVDGSKLWPITEAEVKDTTQGTHHPGQSVRGGSG